MRFDCIVTQVHVPPFDPQGGWADVDKVKVVEFGLKHLRAFNPGACIILTGHGLRPSREALTNCDHVLWNDASERLNAHGYVEGMPAQFKYVHDGLKLAAKLGFDRCLKTRGDCVIGIPGACLEFNEIVDAGGKRLLITQQTGPGRMGDCLMYGDLDVMCRTWHSDNPVTSQDGLQNTAHNYRLAIGDQSPDWLAVLRRTVAFRDVVDLKFACLRWNRVADLDLLMNPDFDFNSIHWGLANGWHSFDEAGNMGGSAAAWTWSRRDFYQ